MEKSKPTMVLISRSVNRSLTGIGKPMAQNVRDVKENTASSSQVWHQNENTRTSIEKSIAKADQRSRIGKPIAKIQNRNRVDPSQLPDLRRPHSLRESLRMYDKN